MTTWTKNLARLARVMKDDPPGRVAINLRDKLETFKPHIPLIAALRNPGLRERHWKAISNVCGNVVRMTAEETTFNHLLAQDLFDHLSEIQEISEYASKEYRLEKQMEKMQSEWKSVQFELAVYSDTHILKSVDEIQNLLDDHIVKTQVCALQS